MDDLCGQTLNGKFELTRKLGAGTFGVVYAARHLIARAELAVKILRDESLQEPLIRNGFVKEARATIGLQSEHIVTVRDIDQDEHGRLFIVMDLIDGPTLGDWIDTHTTADRRVDYRLAVELTRHILIALRDAHAKGVVHRDLKPDNVLVETRDGRPHALVVDFSTAWRTKLEHDDTTEILNQLIGTPAYMSPEQCMGTQLDERSDLYAVGIILYELLTGLRPIEAETSQGYLVAHVAHAPRPLAAVAPDLTLPPGLTRLVMQLLKKQPKDRPSSAADVLEALAHLGEAEALPVGETAPAGGPLRPREPTGEEDTVAAGADVVSAHDAATIAPPSVDPPSPAAAAPARGFHIGWLAAAFILSVLVLAVIHAADLLPSKGPKTTTPPERTSRPVEAPAVEAAPAPDLRRRAATADRRDEVALETAAKPVAEKPKPVAEKPKPKPKPVAETRKPKPKPKPKPVAENPKPVAENPKPVTKRPKPEAVDVAPVRPSRDGTTKDRARGAFDELDDF